MKVSTNLRNWPSRVKNATMAVLFIATYSLSAAVPFINVSHVSAQGTTHEVVCHREGNGTAHAIPPSQTSAHLPNHVDTGTLANSDYVIYAVYPDGADWNDLKDSLDAQCVNEDPADPQPVAAPSFTDPCGVQNDSYTIPTDPYATYTVNGVATAAGTYAGSGSVTIVAVPKTYSFTYGGVTYTWPYELIPPTQWTKTFDTAPCIVPVEAPAPTQAPVCGPNNDTITVPTAEQAPHVSYSVGQWLNNQITVTATANPGYSITGTSSWTFTDENVPCKGYIKVIKNVDTDGDGDIDQPNVTDWNWNINGQGNFSTGSGNAQQVTTGSYTVFEEQKDNYHVTASSCTGEPPTTSPSEFVNVTVSTDETVTCTFTNTRDTGYIVLTKSLLPSGDSGKFDLLLNGVVKADDVGNGGTTGYMLVPTGTYAVSEVAGTGTSLANYSSTFVCWDENVKVMSGSGTSLQGLVVQQGHTISCTFTNARYSSISGFKYEVNADGTQVGATGLSGWTVTLYKDGSIYGSTETGTGGSYRFTDLLEGNYSVFEKLPVDGGWTQIKHPNPIALKYGQDSDKNNFGNFKNGSISGYKWNDIDGDGRQDKNEMRLGDWKITLTGKTTAVNNMPSESVGPLVSKTDEENGEYEFTNLAPGVYEICEEEVAGWEQIFPEDSECYEVTIDESGESNPDFNFGNRKLSTLTIVKDAQPNDAQDFEFTLTPLYRDDVRAAQSPLAKDTVDFSALETSSEGEMFDGSFWLDDDADETLSNSQAFEVSGGRYKVAETPVEGWDLTGIECSGVFPGQEEEYRDGESEYEWWYVDKETGELYMWVNPGSQVTCTFTNTKRATVTITKDAQPNFAQPFTFTTNLGGDEETSFSLTDDGVNSALASRTFSGVVPGVYTVSEAVVNGWTLNGATCIGAEITREGSTVTMEVVPGADVKCTFVNQKNTIPQVLGAVDPPKLENTGGSVWVAVSMSLTVMGLAILTALSDRRRNQTMTV